MPQDLSASLGPWVPSHICQSAIGLVQNQWQAPSTSQLDTIRGRMDEGGTGLTAYKALKSLFEVNLSPPVWSTAGPLAVSFRQDSQTVRHQTALTSSPICR